jgi:hypothetical protein
MVIICGCPIVCLFVCLLHVLKSLCLCFLFCWPFFFFFFFFCCARYIVSCCRSLFYIDFMVARDANDRPALFLRRSQSNGSRGSRGGVGLLGSIGTLLWGASNDNDNTNNDDDDDSRAVVVTDSDLPLIDMLTLSDDDDDDDDDDNDAFSLLAATAVDLKLWHVAASHRSTPQLITSLPLADIIQQRIGELL